MHHERPKVQCFLTTLLKTPFPLSWSCCLSECPSKDIVNDTFFLDNASILLLFINVPLVSYSIINPFIDNIIKDLRKMWIKHDFTPCKCHIMHSAILKLFKNANPVRNPKFFVSTTIRRKNLGNKCLHLKLQLCVKCNSAVKGVDVIGTS